MNTHPILSHNRVGERLLREALASIPNGAASVASATVETRTRKDEFEKVSSLPLIDDKNKEESPALAVTGTLDEGTTRFRLKGGDVQATVSYRTFSCMSADFGNSPPIAVDLAGAFQLDNGNRRGYSPIIPLDGNGEFIPCLTQFHLNLAGASPAGCDVAECNNDQSCPKESYFTKPSLYLHSCQDNEVGNFRLNGATAIANDSDTQAITLGPGELTTDPRVRNNSIQDYFVPSDLNIVIPAMETAVEIPSFEFNAPVNLPVVGATNIPIAIPATSVDIPIPALDLSPFVNPVLSDLIVGLIVSQLQSEFTTTENPGQEPVSQAVRIIMALNAQRVVESTKVISDSEFSQRLTDSSTMQDLVADHPDTLALASILEAMVLLWITASVTGFEFGRLFGLLWKRGIRSTLRHYWHSKLEIARTLGSLFVFVVQIFAFSLAWKDEKEQNAYAGTMTRMEVVSASTSGGVAFLANGQQQDLFTVSVYTARVEDSSNDLTPWFVAGATVALTSMIIAGSFGWDFDATRNNGLQVTSPVVNGRSNVMVHGAPKQSTNMQTTATDSAKTISTTRTSCQSVISSNHPVQRMLHTNTPGPQLPAGPVRVRYSQSMSSGGHARDDTSDMDSTSTAAFNLPLTTTTDVDENDSQLDIGTGQTRNEEVSSSWFSV